MTDINLGSAGTPKCLSKTCSRPAAVVTKRGLCLVCYSRAKKMVESGSIMWEEIVSLGLALPSDAEGGDPFTQALNEARRGRDAGPTAT